MRTLGEYCFVEHQAAQNSWSMYTCVHDWTIAVLNKIIDAQQYWYDFGCVAASINEDDWDSFGNISCARLAANATRLVQDHFHRKNWTDNIVSSRLDNASCMAKILGKQVQLVAAERMFLRAVAGYEKFGLPSMAYFSLGHRQSLQGEIDESEHLASFFRLLSRPDS